MGSKLVHCMVGNINIIVPEELPIEIGKALVCPSSCNKNCKKKKCIINRISNNINGPYVSYSADELNLMLGNKGNENIQTESNNTKIKEDLTVNTKEPINAISSQDQDIRQTQELNPRPKKFSIEKYVSGGKNTAASTDKDKPKIVDNASTESPKVLNKNSIKIGPMEYVYDYMGKNGTKSIRFIFDDLLLHWNKKFVFQNHSKLNSDFVSLLKNIIINYNELEPELKRIESSDNNINDKFYNIFYKIVFNNQNKAFYYSETEKNYSQSDLVPYFDGEEDFFNKYQDPRVYEFYIKHKDIILSYCNRKEEELFKVLTIYYSEKKKKVVYVPVCGNLEYRPKDFGRINEFVEKMHTINDDMPMMIEFLKDFKVTNNGITIRDKKEKEFDLIKFGNKNPNNEVYKALGILNATQAPAEKYMNYISLLKEYIVSNNPNKINIANSFILSKNNFANEVKEIVLNYVSYEISGVANDKNYLMSRHNAYLIKDLIERNVLEEFSKLAENENKINDYIGLLDNINLKSYLKCFNDDALIRYNNKFVKVKEYIKNSIKNNSFSVIIKDKIINEYIELNIKSKTDIEKLIKEFTKK